MAKIRHFHVKITNSSDMSFPSIGLHIIQKKPRLTPFRDWAGHRSLSRKVLYAVSIPRATQGVVEKSRVPRF